MDYDDDNQLGLATILRIVIEECEGIHLVACDDFAGREYLIFHQQYPWNMNTKELAMTKERLDKLFAKYISILTDEPLVIDYQVVENGG